MLSWSLSHTFTDFFSRWNSGYHRAFLTLSRAFSHDGIQAITEPFSHFHGLFLMMEFSRHTIRGKTLFIYIIKSIYIGFTSLKTLPLDLEPPLQGKEYGPSYFKCEKVNVFVPETTYRLVIWIFAFLQNLNLRKEILKDKSYLTSRFSRVIPLQAVSIPRM
jgi:hypothetical protein